MDFETIKFPIAGIVQRQIHFTDELHHYAFSFSSPYVYEEPKKHKDMKAFLIGEYDPFNMSKQTPQKIYSYFTIDKNKETYLDKKENLDRKVISIFNGDDELIGKLDVLSPHSRFLKFSSQYPNILFDGAGEPVGFCHYQPTLKRKSIYAFQPSFTGLHKEIKQDTIRELENQGVIRCIFSYDLLRTDTNFRTKLETMFSSEKKAESIQNRIMMIQKPESNDRALLYLSGVLAFFWDTMIEFPLNEN